MDVRIRTGGSSCENVRDGRIRGACFGTFGSHWYGHLIDTAQDKNTLFVGYLVGAGAMIVGGITAIIFGVNPEGNPLEDAARSLSIIGKPPEAIFRDAADSRLNPSGG
jgi:hypothetical protein